MKRLIIFLVRKRLGLKKFETFRFDNQKSSTDMYHFTEDEVIKRYVDNKGRVISEPSSVSLNWLLDENCKVIKL